MMTNAQAAPIAGAITSRPAAIRATGIDVTYGVQGDQPVRALANVDLDVPGGSFVSLVGPSGCGKSTLLKVVADLMAPTRGTLTIAGEPPSKLRRQGRIGLVFQQANLPRPRTHETRLSDGFSQLVAEVSRELYRVMA